jgi:hypothetical protein
MFLSSDSWPLLLLLLVGAGMLVFWLWMLVDCATKERNEGNDRIVWLLVILLAQILGALVYFYVRRPARMRELGR